MGKRQWPYVWQRVPGLGEEVLTRGTCDGLPVLPWSWADPKILATIRQLRADGLRPGGADPVACLHFAHNKPNRRSLEHANLYRIDLAVPQRRGRWNVGPALRVRRTCTECEQVQPYYLSTISRMCSDCETRTEFWEQRAAEYGFAA